MPESDTVTRSFPHILMLDSGIGGLTIAQAVINSWPQVQITYIADSGAFPYGEREEHDLIERMTILIADALKKYAYDAIIIACNTASTVVLDPLRERWPIPIIGVVPAIKPAAEQSQNRCFGLLATEGTVKRLYIDKLIKQFAHDCRVIKVGSPDLARLAEQKIRGKVVDLMAIKNNIHPFLAHPELDSIVLGCTHYPLLNEELKELLPAHVQLIEPSVAIAKRLGDLLNLKPYSELDKKTELPSHRFFSTGQDNLSELNPFLQKLHFDQVAYWTGDPTRKLT